MDNDSVHVDGIVLVLDNFRAEEFVIEGRMEGDCSQRVSVLQVGVVEV
jgi:hypothetical protein